MTMDPKKNNDEEIRVHKAITQGKEETKSPLQKALGVLITEDFDSVAGSLADDYVKPRLEKFAKDTVRKGKETFVEGVTSMLQAVLFGDSKPKQKEGTYNGQKINYVSYYNGDPYETYIYGPDGSVKTAGNTGPKPVVRRIYIPNYRKAEEVLTEMIALSRRYPSVSVADYYQLVGIKTAKEDYSFGWKQELSGVTIGHTNNGYILNLPAPTPID